MILNVKTNTTLTMEDTVLMQARQAADAEGRTLSARTERAVRAELMRTSAAIAAEWEAEWERDIGDPQARAVAELAEQRVMGEAIRSSGQSW
jgi:hypothetical protein